MRKHIGIYLSLLVMIAIGGCSSSNKTTKKIPEAQVRSLDKSEKAVAPTEDYSIVAIQSKYLLKDTTMTKVYLYADVYKGKNPITIEDFISNYNLNYVIYSDYGTRDRLGYGNVKLTNENVKRVADKIVVTFDLKSPNREYGVLLSEISQIGTLKKVLNDLTVRFKESNTNDQYAIFTDASSEPIQHHFINSNQNFYVNKIDGGKNKLFVYYYSHTFEAAASPMNTAPKVVSKSLVVDSTFTITSGEQLHFTREGLYNIFADTTQKEGLGLLIVNERFPKITQPQLLLEPLLYVSTNVEVAEIKKADNYKKALDKYWLTLMSGNAPVAQQSIRTFYSRIEEANSLFTTYKEGWKTDKGMIYVVLGAPDKVQRSKDKEIWTYNQRGNAQNVNFTFNKRNNQFVDDHYELVRYAEYQPIWYPVVEAWRNGSIR